MKRLAYFVSAVLLVFTLSSSACASHLSETFTLDELGLRLTIPSSYITFTRDIEADDPNLHTYGLTKEDFSALMQERNIYLNAWDQDVNFEIVVNMIESPLADFNQFSDTTLSALMSTTSSEYEAAGITYIKSDFYQHSQAKFIKIYISQPNAGNTVYGLQYHTVYDGKAINITLQSYSGKIDSEKETIIKNIVDSAHFDTEPQLNAPPAQTPEFAYTDKSSGMTFTVPANWVEEPMPQDREFIDAKFASNLEEGLCIIFTSEDIFSSEELRSELTAIEKALLTREDLGSELLTKSVVAEMTGCKEEDISIVTYGGKEYYFTESLATSTVYGITVSNPMMSLIRCENGYLYTFQFNGSSDSPYFADFQKLIKSVDYPEFESSAERRDTVVGAVIILAVALIIAVIVVIIVVCCRAAKKKKAAAAKEKADAPIAPPVVSDAPEVQVPQNRSDINFCHICGNKLASDSCFCNKCGTKVIVEEEG